MQNMLHEYRDKNQGSYMKVPASAWMRNNRTQAWSGNTRGKGKCGDGDCTVAEKTWYPINDYTQAREKRTFSKNNNYHLYNWEDNCATVLSWKNGGQFTCGIRDISKYFFYLHHLSWTCPLPIQAETSSRQMPTWCWNLGHVSGEKYLGITENKKAEGHDQGTREGRQSGVLET